MRILMILSLVSAIFLFSCAGTNNIKGGMGSKVDGVVYSSYMPQHLELNKTYQDLSLYLELTEPEQSAPMSISLDHLQKALYTEFSDQGAVPVEEADLSSISIDIEISRCTTSKLKSKINGKKYQSYIDGKVDCYNSITREKIVTDVYSISGLGSTPSAAGEAVLNKFICGIVQNKELLTYVKLQIRASNNYFQRRLDILAKNLLIEFEKKNLKPVAGLKIAFTEFKNDDNDSFSNIFQSSMQKIWTGSNYKFYTRNQLNQVLDEYKLQLSGLLEASEDVTGNLKPVDLIISGSVSKFDKQRIIEAQILNVHDGELLVSQSVALTLEK